MGLLADISDVHALGLETAQGLRFVEPFYWDLNDGTRAFGRRFADAMRGRHADAVQAGVYGAVLHYLKAVRASGTDAGAAVVAKMKELPTDDPLFGKGIIRADGRKLHPMYLFEVKSPAESQGPLGLLQAGPHDPGRGGVPALGPGRLPDGGQEGVGPDRSPDRALERAGAAGGTSTPDPRITNSSGHRSCSFRPMSSAFPKPF